MRIQALGECIIEYVRYFIFSVSGNLGNVLKSQREVFLKKREWNSALCVAGPLHVRLRLREIPEAPVRKPLDSYLAERQNGKLIVKNMCVGSEHNTESGFLLTPFTT